MSKIFFGVYSYNQKNIKHVNANKYNFYRIFIESLRDKGNNVLCVDSIWQGPKKSSNFLSGKLEEFAPDLCILGNYGYLDLDDFYDGPIWYLDIDSIDDVSMDTIYRIRNKIARCKFIVSEETDILKIKKKFGANEENIVLINLFYDVLAKSSEKKYELLYFGSNKLEKGYSFLSDFNKSQPEEPEVDAAKKVLDEFEKNPIVDSCYLYNQNKSFVNRRISLSAGRNDIKEVLGVKKIKTLSVLSSLELEIKGFGWTHESINYYPELLRCSMKSLDYDVNNYVEELNKAKITLWFDEGPYSKGSYLRLIEALCSDACVVAEYSGRYADILKGAGIFIFHNSEEAISICKDLLKNENKRKQSISHAHKFLKNNYTIQKALKIIEDKFNFSLKGGVDNPSIEFVNEADLKRDEDSLQKGQEHAIKSFSKYRKNVKHKEDNILEIKKIKRQKRLEQISKIAIHFGYDIFNRYEKTVFSIFGFNIYANLKINSDTNHIFFLFFPLLSLNKKNGKSSVRILLIEKMLKAPQKIFRKLKEIRKNKKIHLEERKFRKQKYDLCRNKIKAGQKLTVCLFVSRISCWTFGGLYALLKKSEYFEPIVVVKPFIFQGLEAAKAYMNETYDKLKTEGYNVIKTYDETTNTYMDLRKELNPDILFYTKYWRPQFHENYYIDNFYDKITFYTSYCFDIAYHPEVMNFELNNKVDRYFMPSNIHKEMAKSVMKNKGKNVYVVGAPKIDVFFDSSYNSIDVWKTQEKRKKRIIWAPHHSDNFPSNLYQFNAFYEIAEYMFEIAKKYENEIQIAFKPHPMLKPYLYKKWGEETTDAYYGKWANLTNGQLETGEFIDLFLTSDAMIFDSISFIAEYTAVNKPALFTIGNTSRVQLNDFGNINFEVLYHTTKDMKKDIDAFIQNVVINGDDIKETERTSFIKQYLTPPNGKTSAENIYDNMLDEIMNGDKK